MIPKDPELLLLQTVCTGRMRPFDRNSRPTAMKTSFRLYAAALLAACGFSLPASATTYSPDYTDLWYSSAEAGWGINIIQQRDTIFTSMFVFGTDNTPRWYFASGLTGSPSSFSGTLYRTTGPYFGGTWNPALVGVPTPVGSMTITFSSATAATMTYSVDGVTVSKSLVRNTFRENNLAGNYLGGFVGNASQCSVTTPGGLFIMGELTVEHTTSSPRFIVSINQGATVCTFTGAYMQQGKLGTIPNGTWQCTGGATNSGTFTMTEIYASQNGISGKWTGRDNVCQSYSGFVGGVRDVL